MHHDVLKHLYCPLVLLPKIQQTAVFLPITQQVNRVEDKLEGTFTFETMVVKQNMYGQKRKKMTVSLAKIGRPNILATFFLRKSRIILSRR